MTIRSAPLEPGERDRIVTIQERSSTDAVGGSGFPVEDWSTLVAEMPIAKFDLAGDRLERFTAAQLSAPFNTRWEMNYRADMDPDLVDVPKLRRLVYQTRVHDIVAAAEIGRREGIELLTLATSKVA